MNTYRVPIQRTPASTASQAAYDAIVGRDPKAGQLTAEAAALHQEENKS